MLIPNECFLYIDVAIVVVFIIFALIGYKNGLLLQIIDLVFNFLALFLSWFIAPILAGHFPLVKLNETYTALNINVLMDTLIYCVLVFFILRILYAFIKPLFRFVSKIPLIGLVNKVGGFIMGLINGLIIISLLSMLLNTSLISNGKDIKNETYFKYCDNISSKVIEVSLKYINFDALKNNVDNFDIDESRNEFEKWLIEQGIINE